VKVRVTHTHARTHTHSLNFLAKKEKGESWRTCALYDIDLPTIAALRHRASGKRRFAVSPFRRFAVSSRLLLES
jgi:hypothetical protein